MLTGLLCFSFFGSIITHCWAISSIYPYIIFFRMAFIARGRGIHLSSTSAPASAAFVVVVTATIFIDVVIIIMVIIFIAIITLWQPPLLLRMSPGITLWPFQHCASFWLNFINSLRPSRNRRYNADDIFKRIFMKENDWIPTKISLKFIL